MTFGWILCNDNGKRLANGWGPCNGRASSLRAEAAGMLAVTILVSSIQEYLNHPFEKIPIEFSCDNKTLIDRMSDRQDYKNVYPLMQLLPEMDVTEEIWSQQKLNSISPTFNHVKGHQDNKKDFAELSLLAQLNVGADKLAELAYDYAPKSSKIATVLPRSPAVLVIGGVSITSRYDKRLKLASCKPQYMQYLQEKFGWTNETTNEVDWQALKLGLKRVSRTCLTVKICNDLLQLLRS